MARLDQRCRLCFGHSKALRQLGHGPGGRIPQRAQRRPQDHQEEAAKLKAKLGTGEKRQKKKEGLVGVSYTVDPKPRASEALAELLIDPEAARAPAAS